MAFYASDNLVDSSVTDRSNNCADPCSGGPSWPTPDSLNRIRVGLRFDVAGRDTLRISSHADSTRYSYDRLSRVRARWPSAGATTVMDSSYYDVAGNVKKVRTRRGYHIVTNFDSRNRDTLTVIDSLGTLRKRYSGPLDQLTSVWWSSVSDPIGGVNGGVGYRFDQRGRLLSDTSFAGTNAQVTSYSYDTWERVSTVTDPLGAWTTRYETAREIADTLITPYADTVIYTFDARGRTLGPTIQAGGGNPVHTMTPKWNAGLALDTLTRKVGASVTGQYVRAANWTEDGSAIGPTWIDAGGVHWSDSLVYDAWNRLAVRVLRKDGALSVRDSFNFDPNGNLKTTAGSEQYDRFDRLLSRAGAGCTWNYTYDDAGNLTAATCGATSWAYGYDPLDRLNAVWRNSTLIARYGYDVLGRRIVKNVYSSSSGGIVAYTRYVYHGDHVAYEATQAGRITLRYTWGRSTDDLLAVRDSLGNHVYMMQDRLRSIRAAYKRDGTWQMSLTYATYGAKLDSTGTLPFELRYRWTGREYDAELGWYYFRSRYYDPSARRFIQEDAAGYGGGGNLYTYVEGDPLEARDPSGLSKDCEYGACQNPHNWSGANGLGADGSRVCDMFCDMGGAGYELLDMWDRLQQRVDGFFAAAQQRQIEQYEAARRGMSAGMGPPPGVEVGCRQVHGIPAVNHCAIRVTYQTGEVQSGELLTRTDLMCNCDLNDVVTPIQDLPHKYTWQRIATPMGQTPDGFAHNVWHQFGVYAGLYEGLRYTGLGYQNSNHFVYVIIRAAGGTTTANPRWGLTPGLCGGSFLNDGC